MPRPLVELEAEAKALSVQDRAHFAHDLISSLDAGDDGDVEQLWLEEAEHRYQAYRQGKLTAKSAVEVMDKARTSLK